MSKLAAAALALPGCMMAAATALGLVLTAVDQPPMWPHQPVNLAEAAGARDESELVRLIEAGGDPNARYPIRPGWIFGPSMQLTPLEAAVANDDPAMVTRLLAKGASLDASLWTYLRCIAEGDSISPALDQLQPRDAVLSCDGIVAPWQVDDGR